MSQCTPSTRVTKKSKRKKNKKNVFHKICGKIKHGPNSVSLGLRSSKFLPMHLCNKREYVKIRGRLKNYY
jgi:hypothetical protein